MTYDDSRVVRSMKKVAADEAPTLSRIIDEYIDETKNVAVPTFYEDEECGIHLDSIGYEDVQTIASTIGSGDTSRTPLTKSSYDVATAFHRGCFECFLDKPSLGVTILLVNFAKYCADNIWPIFVNNFALIDELCDLENFLHRIRYDRGVEKSTTKAVGSCVLKLPRTLALSRKHGVESYSGETGRSQCIRYSEFGRVLDILVTAPFDLSRFREELEKYDESIRDSIFAFGWFTKIPRELIVSRDLSGTNERASCRLKMNFIHEYGFDASRYSHWFVLPKNSVWFTYDTSTCRTSFSKFVPRNAGKIFNRKMSEVCRVVDKYDRSVLYGFFYDDRFVSVCDVKSKSAINSTFQQRAEIIRRMSLYNPWRETLSTLPPSNVRIVFAYSNIRTDVLYKIECVCVRNK
ncbi:hypothetical protein QAD02_001472 [Eretmocerus hayati]|uniref:Uncharacterized protein n=1 Tax=Eretmocerus hayati TaxID=131215 RepID=A0ACC2NH29_9HYME|nr:hypothetical protein QAD02_001472 [Eretmocerus hayati]